MKRAYLGDSFDAVKRLWRDLMHNWAPLYAESRFIPYEMQAEFTRLTRIQILSEMTLGPLSILNDPDTGIRLPGEKNQREGRTHIAVSTIATQLKDARVKCVITFDQSDYRHERGKPELQRSRKMEWLRNEGLYSLYYISHAPFCFAVSTNQAFIELKDILIKGGIPTDRPNRLEEIPEAGEPCTEGYDLQNR